MEKNRVIFLVDDELVIRRLMRKLLEGEGYKVLEAESCPSARDVWEKHHAEIDVLIVDLMMPDGATGQSLARDFIASKPSLRVVFASGYGLGENNDPANEAFFIQKPFDIPVLLKTVKTALGGN